MRLVKLSLVTALAVGSFSALNAKPLEEAIKNVDFTGELRYRYENNSENNGQIGDISSVSGKQDHRIRVRLGLKADVGDGFKIFGQAQYANDKAAGYINSNTPDGRTPTNKPFNLRQAYLQYDLADYGFGLVLGRQELGTIWTSDFVGTAAKAIYSPADGISIAAFAVDSFEENTGDSDAISVSKLNLGLNEQQANSINSRIYQYNMYGAAFLGKDIGGSGFDANIWFAQLMKTATFYAADLAYTLPLGEQDSWKLRFTYMGNNVDNSFNELLGDIADSGQLFNLYGTVNLYGFDGTLGGIMYGKKNKVTINTIEDTGSAGLNMIGREILYGRGSWTGISNGQTTLAYASVGYTLPGDFRVGLRGVIGGTSDTYTAVGQGAAGGGDKSEYVLDLDYKYSNNLKFFGWYSILNYDNKVYGTSKRDAVRLQAAYTF